MGKSPTRKKQNKNPISIKQKSAILPIESHKSFLDKLKARAILYKFYLIAVGIITFFSWPQTCNYIKDQYFTTKQEKHNKDYFTEGAIQPPKFDLKSFNSFNSLHHSASNYTISKDLPNFDNIIYNNSFPVIKGIPIVDLSKRPYLFVFASGYLFTCLAGDLYKGVDIFNPVFSGCYSQHLILGVKDNKLYISTELKDLNDNYLGSINFNHWKIYNPNVLFFNDTDPEKLEIKDRQNYTVLSVSYQANTIMIGGYFMGDKSVIIFPNDPLKSKSINPLCILKSDSAWKQKAIDEISIIKSVYK